MHILNNISIYDLTLYLQESNTLVFGDSHIGYEEALNKQGVLIPRFQFKEVLEKLGKVISAIKKEHNVSSFSSIVINGDVKHEFGTISEQEWRHTLRLLDFLLGFTSKIVLVKGNHDTILGPIAKKREVKVEEHVVLGDVLVIHGDKLPSPDLLKKVSTIIIGHEHPAVSIADGVRQELYKCFLRGKWKRKNLIVMPSFNLVKEGADVLKSKPLSPFLQGKLDNFDVYPVADRVYEGVKLKKLR